MSKQSPADRHREEAQLILNAPVAPWHDRQARLHRLVSEYPIDRVSEITGFSIRTIQVYLSYKPYACPADSTVINEHKLARAEQELKENS